jgi:alpha-amylase
MPSICLYFQVHQPMRVKRFRVFDIGNNHNYFDDNSETNLNNNRILNKVAKKSYLPTNKILLELLNKYPDFKISFSLSGIVLEQMEEFNSDVLDSFKRLVDTGRVEILSETYYHSLAFFYSLDEFEKQVKMHDEKIRELFGVKPSVFRNTELAYTNALGIWAEQKGYKGIICEGWDHYLRGRSPNFLYRPKNGTNIKMLLKNYKLSDDIAFRFSEQNWKEWPLDAPKFGQWVNAINGNGETVNLFMDYETFGEHQWESTGIFNFLRSFPEEIMKNPDNRFLTPSEVVNNYEIVDELDVPYIMTWADTERDLSAWIGNDIQKEAIRLIYGLEEKILKKKDKKLIDDWRKLQTSDHYYYMCTKWFNDGDVHAYFNPYNTPYEAFITFMNAYNDLKLRVLSK